MPTVSGITSQADENGCGQLQITQLGHVKDLATSFKLILDNEKANGQIYNISGERWVPPRVLHAVRVTSDTAGSVPHTAHT